MSKIIRLVSTEKNITNESVFFFFYFCSAAFVEEQFILLPNWKEKYSLAYKRECVNVQINYSRIYKQVHPVPCWEVSIQRLTEKTMHNNSEHWVGKYQEIKWGVRQSCAASSDLISLYIKNIMKAIKYLKLIGS